VPPSFAPTHAWVGPIWLWSHGQETFSGPTIFDSARTRIWATTTMVYIANSRSAAISIHVDCYLSDGTLDTGVRVAADVAPRNRFQASLLPTRAPVLAPNGDFRDGGEGWFHLWANGPVTPAAMIVLIHTSPEQRGVDMVVPVKPVEIEAAAVAAEAPPYVEVEAAPEGVAGAAEETLEANLTPEEAVAWFASVRTGRPFHRREK
jgi:hypothetical protein